MKQLSTLMLCLLAVLFVGTSEAGATLSDYSFATSTDSWIKTAQSTSLLSPGADDETSPVTNIGFTFVFDGVSYTQFSVSSNGLIGLGSQQVSPCWSNQLTTPSGLCDQVNGFDYTLANVPHIAPFWDDMRVPDQANDGFDGEISYGISGSAPNRILVINFVNVETDYFNFNYSSFQVRLYEKSNKIEFYYDFLNPNYFGGDGASIGLAMTSQDFLSVYPDFGGASANGGEPNDSYFPSEPSMDEGMLYTFTPCQVNYVGDVAEGGTAAMDEGDVLLAGKQTMVYTTATYYPFSMSTDAACSSRVVTATIDGPDALDYTFDPESADLFSGDEPTVATIWFHPTAVGVRNARLVLTDDHGGVRTFMLAAEGLPRIIYSGDIPQGGTPTMANGETLMSAIHVKRGASGDFTPMTLTNILEDVEAPDAPVTYQIMGLSGGQYAIAPGDTQIASGESHTPTITFMPTGIGSIRDSLIVVADGERRAFQLLANSDGIGAELLLNNQPLVDGAQLFSNAFSCAGEEPVTLPVVVRNVGNLPFEITGADFYAVDTVFKQGVPRYPILRTNNEQPIRSNDYIITETVPVVPITSAQAHFPIMVDVGATKTIYVTFIGQLPGKRFVRAFVHTNAENFSALDQDGEQIEGLITFDLFGRGRSAHLAGAPNGDRPRPVQFGERRVGDSVTMAVTLMNTGTCPLRISLPRMEIVAGDVDEFSIITKPSSTVDPVTNDLVLAPGASDLVVLRFIASHRGSRRATLRLVTNDSTIGIAGITERGVQYLDLYGQGKADLYASNADLGQALIGGGPAEHTHGVVRLRNTQDKSVVITGIKIGGVDAAEFMEDVAKKWPTVPLVLQSGDPIDLGIEFAPGSGGTPGSRDATVTLYLDTGDSIVAGVYGVAGTRLITVNPTTINLSVSTGGQARRSVAISNSGTMPLKITGINVSAPDFTVTGPDRTELVPGQTEMLEITFTPQGPGLVNGTVTIESNGTNGSQVITLNGAASTRRVDDPAGMTIGSVRHDGRIVSPVEEFSVSGVTGVRDANGTALLQSIPNPARDVVEIGWVLPRGGAMSLQLFDAAGRMVRTLVDGVQLPGDGSVRLDVSGLASGAYFYRLNAGGLTLTRGLTVTR